MEEAASAAACSDVMSAMSSTIGPSVGETISVSTDELARQSGFASSAVGSSQRSGSMPGAYLVTPAGAVGRVDESRAQPTEVSDLTASGVTSDTEAAHHVAVAHLVEDATCEPIPEGDASGDDPTNTTVSASRQQTLGSQNDTNGADDTVIVAEKLDSRSVSICGKHGRFQRWHCLVLGGLLLAICIAVPTAVVLSNKSQKGEGEESAPEDTTFDWTKELIESIVVPSVSYPSTLDNANSPQSRAIDWLASGGADIVTGTDIASVEWRVRQRYCLAVLYYSTNGEGWKNQYDYLNNTKHECDWSSDRNNGWRTTECNEDLEVTLINLWQNNLRGPMPRELARLPQLTTIDFLTNRITGTIPEEITTLRGLTYLNLGYNRFTGTVSANLGNLDQITYLMMDFNDLVGTIPAELGKLVQLPGWLSLEGNNLHGTVPESFADLTNATWIYLNANDLTGSVEFLCDALQPVEGPGFTNDNSTSPLLELWVDVDEVNCTCCNCCPYFD